jgi:multiple sugar transport system substrate-binding protein
MLLCAVTCSAACRTPSGTTLVISGSSVGAEGAVLVQQLTRFESTHPGVHVTMRPTPDAADQRHQLYVQWLNARASDPDVLQLDTIWTTEFAAAGWIAPLDRFHPPVDDFFPAAVAANRWRGALYAIPWFVDVGLLYWRTDLLPDAPTTLAGLRDTALAAQRSGKVSFGLVWQGARYEGLVTVFIEHLTAFGGAVLDANRGTVTVDAPPAVRALTFMRDAVWSERWVSPSVLTWQEEQTRFAFQNGQAAVMRNWPYAWRLLQDPKESRVAGRIAVAPFPAAPGGRASAALGGAELAVNAHSDHPALAWALVEFLTAREQMAQRAQIASQIPARRSALDLPGVADALPAPASQLRAALDAATPRPVTPVYTELSEILQVYLHRALTRQQAPDEALHAAAADIRALLVRSGLAVGSAG